MRGLSQKEWLKTALIHLNEAEACIDAALDRVEKAPRAFPLPETRDHLRQLRRLKRDLEVNWLTVWRNQW